MPRIYGGCANRTKFETDGVINAEKMLMSVGTRIRRKGSSALRKALRSAKDYDSWADLAQQLDARSGREQWKLREATNLYDYEMIGRRLNEFRSGRARGDIAGLIFAIEEGVHGNLGGMGQPLLYNKARFGTKQQVVDFVDEVCKVLGVLEAVPDHQMSLNSKLDLFGRARHCYGRSALMLSSGGALMYFHFGVARSLLARGLLPNLISGSSAGAIVAAVLGSHSDEALGTLLTGEKLRFGADWQPNLIERTTGLRRLYDASVFEQMFEQLIPDLTFREAFELSGREISISVSPCERHQRPRLLNAITSPHVLIRSAVQASCSVPGVFEPVQLLARDAGGQTVPYLKSKWIDGIFAADLPAKQLGRIYGANHYIVSYVNPLLVPEFRDNPHGKNRLKPMTTLLKNAARDWLKSADVMLGKYLPESTLGIGNKILHDLLSQNYVGDINISPSRRLVPLLKLLSPATPAEIDALILEGQRHTWPKMQNIQIATQISRKLDDILRRTQKRQREQSGRANGRAR